MSAITNMVELVTLVTLVTNTVIKWPEVFQSRPCPENKPGCCVIHGEMVPDTSADHREKVTEVLQRTTFRIWDHTWYSDFSISKTSVWEKLETIWVPGKQPEPQSASLIWQSYYKKATNVLFINTNGIQGSFLYYLTNNLNVVPN